MKGGASHLPLGGVHMQKSQGHTCSLIMQQLQLRYQAKSWLPCMLNSSLLWLHLIFDGP